MNLTLTAKIQIYPSKEQQIAFEETMLAYTKALNFVSNWVFDNNFNLSQSNLHENLYYVVREKFNLKAQFTASVLRDVIAKYKTSQTQLRKQGKTLEYIWYPIHFEAPQLTLVRNRDYSFVENNLLSINTLGSREKMNYTFKGMEHFLEDYKLGTAKLVNKHNKWFLHISATKDFSEFQKENVEHVVGIDRGLRFLITYFDEKGKSHFMSGKEILAKRKHYRELRKSLQEKNTKSSKRRIREIGQRENRWMTDVNHQISKALVDYYGPNTLYVLEDLTGVSFSREELPKHLRNDNSSWAFYELEQFITYKAHMNQSLVLSVDAHYTSQRCPKCGTIDKTNRNHQNHSYCCKNCGYQSNDDRVAAINIQQLGTEWISGVERPRYTINKTD